MVMLSKEAARVKEEFHKWKEGMLGKGLKINMEKN